MNLNCNNCEIYHPHMVQILRTDDELQLGKICCTLNVPKIEFSLFIDI